MNQVREWITYFLTTHTKLVTFGIGLAVALGLSVATMFGESYEALAEIQNQNSLQN